MGAFFPAARGGQGAKLAGGDARSAPLTVPSRRSPHDHEIDGASDWASAFWAAKSASRRNVEGLFVLGGAGRGQRSNARKAQRAVLVAHVHVALQEVEQRDLGPAQGDAGTAGLHAMNRAADAEGQGLRQGALLASGQRLIERVQTVLPRAVRVLAISRRQGEPGVPSRHEGRREGLSLLDRRYPPQAHLPHQPVLQGLVGPLDAALGLRGERGDQLDAQSLGDAAEFGLAVAADRVLGVDAEDAVPIRIERQRTAVRHDMAPERPEIGARRLARRELQRRQPPRRVVDEHDQPHSADRAPRTNRAGWRRSGSIHQSADAARAVETPAYDAAASVSKPRVRSEAAEPSRARPRSLPVPPASPPPASGRNPCTCPEESPSPGPSRLRPNDDSTSAPAGAKPDRRRPVLDRPEQAVSPAERKAPAAPLPAPAAKPCSRPAQSPPAVRAPPNSSPKSPRPFMSPTLPEGDIPTLLKGDILMLR